MTIQIVRLGSPRGPDEGLRIGTVRRPPRGVPKHEFASRNYYDVWLPTLSPSTELMAKGKAAQSPDAWRQFARAYQAEMNQGEADKVLNVMAALSKTTHFSMGCYCEDESRCHRSILRDLLQSRGAELKSR